MDHEIDNATYDAMFYMMLLFGALAIICGCAVVVYAMEVFALTQKPLMPWEAWYANINLYFCIQTVAAVILSAGAVGSAYLFRQLYREFF